MADMLRKVRHRANDLMKIRRESSKDTSAEIYARHAPQPLPQHRSSVLSLLELPDYVPDNLQSRSDLLCRLPYEVRRQIYEEVLGGYLLHVVRMQGRLAHVKCWVPQAHGTNTRSHDCWGYMDKEMIYLRGRPSDGGLLGLLMTCRKV